MSEVVDIARKMATEQFVGDPKDDVTSMGLAVSQQLRLTREYCVRSCLIQLLFGTYFYLNFQYLKSADYLRT